MKKSILLFGCSLMTFYSFGQDQWKLGGNTDFGPPPAQGLVSNSNYLGSLQNTPIVFGTNGINRMLTANGGTLNSDGRIAMGNDLPLGFTPTARLHLHQTEPTLGLVNTTTKYTDLSTGFNANDGFEVGYSSSSSIPFVTFAQLRNRENTPMKFFTNDTERLSLSASGELIINSLACADCLVMTNQNGELYADNRIIKNMEDKIKILEQKLLELENLLAQK